MTTGTSYSEKIQEVLDSADVALFMKGTPDAIMCGNSERALGARPRMRYLRWARFDVASPL